MSRMLTASAALWSWLALAFGSTNLAWAENPFCKDRGLIIRAPANPPSDDLNLLLTHAERKDPKSIERLSSNDGPYGHSELGFRYLLRAFGYRGDFEDPAAPEIWLTKQLERNQLYRGADKLWLKWVTASDIMLRTKENMRNSELEAFFKSKVEAIQFSQCLATDIAVKRCENYHNKTLLAGARVYFGGDSAHEPCAIHYNGGTLQGSPPQEMSASFERQISATKEGWKESRTVKSSWKWTNPNHWDPKSENGRKTVTTGGKTAE